MDKDAVTEELRSVIADIAEVDTSEIGPKTEFMFDLDMDSLMALEVLAMLEKKYSIRVPEEMLPSLTTLEGVVDVVLTQSQGVEG